MEPELRGLNSFARTIGSLSWRSLATSEVVVRLYEILDLVDDLKQRIHCGVGPLRVTPTDADRARLKRVHGELYPGQLAARVHGVGLAADDQMRVEALDTFSKRFKLGSVHLDVRADTLDASRDDLSVSTVVIF